jgi:hypothetical protein
VIKVRKKKKQKENTPKFLTDISGTKQKFIIIIIFMELACGDGRYFFGRLLLPELPCLF